jgi:HEPN domain-containing protein
MGKEEQIGYWISSADEDWEAIQFLTREKRLLHADNTEDFPPKVHNLEFLYDQINLELPNEWIDELRIINSWNIEGRYPDYRKKISKSVTEEYVNEKMKFVSKLRECLINNLQSSK